MRETEAKATQDPSPTMAPAASATGNAGKRPATQPMEEKIEKRPKGWKGYAQILSKKKPYEGQRKER